MEENIEEVLQACYKKFKSSVYFDKTVAILRGDIAKFESSSKFSTVFNNMAEAIESDDKWEAYINGIINKVGILSFPKKINNSSDCSDSDIIVNRKADSSEISIENSEGVQNIIDMPVEGHILGVLWILKIGAYLDKNFSEYSCGNRVLIDNISIEEKTKLWSPYLFKPYYDEYQRWRDGAVNHAEDLYDKKKDSLIIMLDIKRFYYSIDFEKSLFEELIQTIDVKESLETRLNKFVYSVIKQYSDKYFELNKEEIKKVILPIGFLPSHILANWYMDKFDVQILDKINPYYYGRYVDDIIIVEKIEKKSKLADMLSKSDTKKKDILKYLFIDNGLLFLEEDGESDKYCISPLNKLSEKNKSGIENKTLYIQDNKLKLIHLKSKGTKSMINNFKEEIKKNSSEFRMLPEGNSLFLDDHNKIYKLEQDEYINKLRGIKGIKLNKYELSKFIGKQLTIANYIDDSKESKFYEDLDIIFDNYTIIENYTMWESILTLCLINNKYEKFIDMIERILNAINKISKNAGNVIISLSRYLQIAIARSMTLVEEGIERKNILCKIGCNKNSEKFPNIDMDLFKVEEIMNIKNNLRSTRMVNKMRMPVLIDNFLDGEGEMLLKNDNDIRLSELDDCIDNMIKNKMNLWLNEFETDNVDDKAVYKYYPYLITHQDITKQLFLINAIKEEEALQERRNTESLSSKIERIYQYINYRIKLSDESKLIKSIVYKEGSNFKKFNIIKINNDEKDELKIAIGNTMVNDKNFIDRLMDKPNRSLDRYNMVTEIINQSIQNDVDILIFPENYIPFEWLPLLEREVKKGSMAIITGVEHLKVGRKIYNTTAVMLPYKNKEYKFVYTNLRTKVHYSPEERRQINGFGECDGNTKGYKAVEGNEYNLFVWNNIWIPVYCCFEIASIEERAVFESLIDLYVIVEWNKDTKYFREIIGSLSRDLNCYCVQVNTSNYGDSCLIAPSKSYEKTKMNIKGGENSSILINTINFKELREFQVKSYELQKDKNKFKPTPPNFKKDYTKLKLENKLFDYLDKKDKENR